MKSIYLDYNATSPIRAEVLDAMLPYLRDNFGNPSSVHWAGRAVSGAIEEAREQVAGMLGAKPADIVFTSCGSEGNNLLIKGTAATSAENKRHIISSVVEHPSVLGPLKALGEAGYEVTLLPVDGEGCLDLEKLEAAIRPDTLLISIMAANNETGNLYPIDDIAQIARKHDVRFHSDLVQTAGKVPMDVTACGLDLAAISGHKFGAPKGVGAVYVRAGCALTPLIHGGHQERNRRAGTLNVAGIVGLGAASALAARNLTTESERIRQLRDRLEGGLRSQLPDVLLNGSSDREQRLPNTSNLSFCGVEAESLLMNLDLKGVAAASGSACSSGTLEPSHVIAAMGVSVMQAQSSVRFSLGPETSLEQIDYLLAELPPLVNRLRAMSPL